MLMMMPAKMIIEMPLPMPRSVICSPSHMMKAVPDVSVIMHISGSSSRGRAPRPRRTGRPRGRRDQEALEDREADPSRSACTG